MKSFILIVGVFFYFSISANAQNSESDVEISHSGSIAILVDRSFITPNVIYTISAPWMVSNFSITNRTRTIITIVDVSAKTFNSVYQNDNPIYPTIHSPFEYEGHSGVIFPDLDTDCDGQVSDAELIANTQPQQPCLSLPLPDLDGTTSVTLFNSANFIFGKMAGRLFENNSADSASTIFRNATFTTDITLSGWFGTPWEPKSNFIKTTSFETVAN